MTKLVQEAAANFPGYGKQPNHVFKMGLWAWKYAAVLLDHCALVPYYTEGRFMFPIGNRIVVQRDALKGERKTEGGLFLPESTERRPQEATVVAVGPGLRTMDGKIVRTQCQPGDRVLLGSYAGTDATLNGNTYTVLKDDEVLIVLSKSETTRVG